jgi:hypoxanthine phosphoribosyltransferase
MRQELLTWNDVDKLIDQLLPQIRGTFDSMLMITRGGLVPGGILAEALDIRHVLTAAVRFPEFEEKMLAWPTFLQFPEDELLRDRRVLIVDDVWNSARTINTVRGRVESAGAQPQVAVLHYKPGASLFKTKQPEYYAATTDAFIIYPWETKRSSFDVRLLESAPLG